MKTKIIQKIIPGLIKEEFVEERTSDDNTARADPPRGNLPTVPELLASSPVSLRSPNRFEIGATDLSPPGIFSQSSGDGMYLGSDHPIWGIGRDPGTRSGSGPWGGDGFLPPMGAPPNARFDPINPIPPSRRGPLRRTGEPDNDEHMPPGPVRRSSSTSADLLNYGFSGEVSFDAMVMSLQKMPENSIV